jgi:hypothetical protein
MLATAKTSGVEERRGGVGAFYSGVIEMSPKCAHCDDTGWLCEAHPDQPYSDVNCRNGRAVDQASSQRWMISAPYGRRGRPAQALSRACTASRWYPSTWFSNRTEMLHDS